MIEQNMVLCYSMFRQIIMEEKVMYSQTIPNDKRRHSFDIPALVQTACTFESRITLHNNQGGFNVKSIMGMMSFDFFDGKLTVSADGSDEQSAVESIISILSE